MNTAAWSNSTKRWAEAGNSNLVGQSQREFIEAGRLEPLRKRHQG
jgi:hypothetical protein